MATYMTYIQYVDDNTFSDLDPATLSAMEETFTNFRKVETGVYVFDADSNHAQAEFAKVIIDTKDKRDPEKIMGFFQPQDISSKRNEWMTEKQLTVFQHAVAFVEQHS